MTTSDIDWANRQKPFPHSHPMPRLHKHFCASCVEVVINAKNKAERLTQGVYLPIEHDCARVRVYDLQGVLLEVKEI